ncbi:hypothetical protein PAAG_11443 [Paracoccidioides lutzii Pb01]|uniref:Cysteine-rich transmembrane CYSTM domain-containing protein n=1 Tax=Paracoccidioides lutzii (strain ATCC MYA-826 / Pb01) TaxID=502779 RepID=A0A0A2V692_PARBA|nr:hypothetical protein PAAG_11443 [Paracoccidioides lutzii Pb01]KGQ01867.1 hypothetical protein PAAG_11443 [Paracoccidioides lutzii Pb01]
MSDNKHNAPPPSYPPATYQDAGPYPPPPAPYAPSPSNTAAQYYNQPQQYGQQQPPPGQYYPPQQGYQQQPMYYGPQCGPPPQGHYVDNRDTTRGAGTSICAGLLAGLACCCCLDFLF